MGEIRAASAPVASLLLLFLHQPDPAAAFLLSSKTASVLRGDKKDGCCSLASPYCHKSCCKGLEGKEVKRPFVESGVLGLGSGWMLGRPNSGRLSNLGRGDDQRGEA